MPAALGKRTGAMAEKHSRVVERDLVPCGAVNEKLSLQFNLPSSHKSHFGEGITIDEMKELCWLPPKLVAQVSVTE
jgi:hypothetical protein